MSKVDDELTRRFHRVERPVDVDGLFEGLERRRSHRERVRRIQAGALAVAVIAATVVGFVGLRVVFEETETDIGDLGHPQPSQEPDASQGRDIGLSFRLCHPEALDNIDWYGEDVSGTAWTGTRPTADGRCPEVNTGEYIVVADLDGDGQAEPGGLGFLDSCLFCRPYATADLDADGVLELVVLEEASSTPSYSFFEVSVPTSERSPGIYNLLVARPGHPEARIRPGEPLRITAGGDEGYSSEIVCEPPVLTWTWAFAPVDSQDPSEVHYVELELVAGVFVVVGSSDLTVPAGEPTGTEVTEPSCGVDWHPAA